jgi:uncharacterized protein (TIGR03437 family)
MVCGLQCTAAPPASQLSGFEHHQGKELPLILKNTLSTRCLPLLLFAASLSATPRLSLVQTSVTVPVVQGSNGPTQFMDAFNIGSGSLSLTASSNVTWLATTIGAETVCGLRGSCYPITIALNTSSLATGIYTGTVTLADPNAIDSPQSFNVVVQVGGDVPSTLQFYLAPGGSTSSSFTTGSAVKATVSASTPWLTVSSATAQGLTTVTVHATASSSMAANAYDGTVTISGSKFAPDNEQISVVLNVTAEPIVQVSSSSVSFTIAQGANKQTAGVSVTNGGQGTLTISSVTAAAANSGTWLSVSFAPSTSDSTFITITADPTGLTPNTYTGTVTIASNAAGASTVIPVLLTVVAQTPPVAFAGGAVNNGNFGSDQPLAQGDIAAVFGSQFTYGAPQSATSLPLKTTLDDVQVLVNGKAAPIYYVSPGQINFEVPIDASIGPSALGFGPNGSGTVQVVRNGQPGNLIYVEINARAPQFIVYNGGYGVMTTPQGALTGIPSHPVNSGDVVVIYALGLGPTSPPVDSGTASPPAPSLADVPGTTQVCFGVETPFHQAPCATAFFSGLTPGFVALYQINVTVPKGIASGNNTMSLLLVDNVESSSVLLAVQ